MLKTANEVVGKIGDPKPINVESKPEQQQQHQNLQQNVSGQVQRNMSGRKSANLPCSQGKQYYDKLNTQSSSEKQQVVV